MPEHLNVRCAIGSSRVQATLAAHLGYHGESNPLFSKVGTLKHAFGRLYSGWRFPRPGSGVAQLKARNGSPRSPALAEDASEEDEAFLRPAVPVSPLRSGGKRARRAVADRAGADRAEPNLVPNYDPDLEPGEDVEQFLRSRRRVPPRKGGRLRALAHTRTGLVLIAVCFLALIALLGMGFWAVRSFLMHDPHFRIDSSASIQATGITELSRTELVNVFGSDIGRNVFFVPLVARRAVLEAQPWVRHATVMRMLPNTLRVTIEERVPIAFVRVGRQIELVDGEGVLLPMLPATLAARHYSFPVVTGLDPAAAPGERAERMHLYQSFVSALDGPHPGTGGANISSQLSEVDLSSLDDVRAVVPAQGSDILLHFGNSDFLERYHSYQEHLAEWRQQYPNLSAVDLRYDRQVVLKMADAAQADEAEAQAAVTKHGEPARPGPKAAPAHAVAAHKATGAKVVHAVHNAASRKPGHGTASKGTWYTQTRSGPDNHLHWVAHYSARPPLHAGHGE